MSDKIEIFRKYISQQGLKLTRQRKLSLMNFSVLQRIYRPKIST